MKKSMVCVAFVLSALLAVGGGISAMASEAGPVSSGATSAPAASSQAANSQASSAATSAPAATVPAATAAAAPADPAGSYASYDEERYPDDRAPTLELSSGGGFVFQFNLGDGRLAVMTGTYVNSGGTLQLEVLYSDSTDFLGEDVTSFAFTQDGATSLIYQGEPLGMSRSGDVFTKEGAGGSSSGLGQNMYILGPGEVVDL